MISGCAQLSPLCPGSITITLPASGLLVPLPRRWLGLAPGEAGGVEPDPAVLGPPVPAVPDGDGARSPTAATPPAAQPATPAASSPASAQARAAGATRRRRATGRGTLRLLRVGTAG